MSKSQSKKMKLLVASLAVGSLYFMPVSQAATVAGDSVTWHDTSGTIQASASSASLKNQNGSGISVRYTSENPDNPDLTKQADAIMFNLSGVNNGKPVLFVNKNGATFYTGVTATKLTADTLTLGTNTLTPDALGKLNAIAATGGADFSKYEAAGIVPGTATDRNSSYKANPSIAIGEKAKAGDSSVTIGNGSYSHVYGVAIGSLSQATGNGAVAIGGKNNASGTSSVAIGQESLATGEKSVALGYQANTNKHANSIAIGSESRVYEDNVVSVGNVNNKRRITNVGAAVDDTDAVNYKQLKESDALDVQYDDNAKDTITLGGLDENGKPATDAVKITNVADANFAKGSTDAVNAGQLYAAGIVPGTAGTGAIAIGDGSKANDYATVLGNGSQAGSGGVAVGSGSNSANTAVAIGEKAKAVHTALAAGPDAKALGEGSVALGKGANVTGKNSIALGADTKVWNKNSVVIGYQSSTYEDNTVSVGNDKLKRKVVNVAAGEADTDAVNVK